MANFYWIDTMGAYGWDDIEGWSSVSGGGSGLTTPGTGDSVFFDNTVGLTAPTAGPAAPVSIASLNTTGFAAFPLPDLTNVTVTGTATVTGSVIITPGPLLVATYNGTGTPVQFAGIGLTVASLTMNDSATTDTQSTVFITITNVVLNDNAVWGGHTATLATFNDSAEAIEHAKATAAIFNDSSTCRSDGVTGLIPTATFNNTSSLLMAGVIGAGTWNNSATCLGTFTTGTFNGTSNNDSDTAGAMTMAGSATNTGTATVCVMTSNTNSNAGGTVTGKLTVPGTQAGGVLTSNIALADLGTFGEIAISGASSGGGGGPLGGPEFLL